MTGNNNRSKSNTTTTGTSYDYDYIIVGGGTSCMGILYGLLDYDNSNNNVNNNNKYHQHYHRKIRIAVIERGSYHLSSSPSSSSSSSSTSTSTSVSTKSSLTTTVSSSSSKTPNNNNDDNDENRIKKNTNTTTNMNKNTSTNTTIVQSLHRWCAASHPTYWNTPGITTMTTERKTKLYSKGYEGRLYYTNNNTTATTNNNATTATTMTSSSVPLLYRIIDVPTGYGMGGTTLINAGLITPPAMMINNSSSSSSIPNIPTMNNNNKNNNNKIVKDDNQQQLQQDQQLLLLLSILQNDFHTWPDTISNHIYNSITTIVQQMSINQCIHPTCCNINNTNNNTSSSSNAYSTEQHQSKDSSLLWVNTTFPSTRIGTVPCAVRKRRTSTTLEDTTTATTSTDDDYERVSYYESLVEPLLLQQQQQLLVDNKLFDISILTDYNVERLLISNNDTTTTTTTSTSTNNSTTCIGVEVQNQITGRYEYIYSTYDTILCTGTVISPALLLLLSSSSKSESSSQTVVHNDNNTNTTTTTGTTTTNPNTSNVTTATPTTTNIVHNNNMGGVGCQLKDHILIPRAILTYPDVSSYRNNALNGVRAISNVIVPSSSSSLSSLRSTKDTTTITSSNNASNTSNVCTMTKAQISLMDSAAYMDLIPIMAAAPFRLQFQYMNNLENNKSMNMYYIYRIINTILYIQYLCIQCIFYVLVHYTPIHYIVKYCIKIIAIFVMNEQSSGSITISRKKYTNQSSNRSTLYTNDDIIRLCDVDIHIQLGYLSNPIDIEHFKNAFTASIDYYNHIDVLGGTKICELFPGPLIWNYSNNNENEKKKQQASSFVQFHEERFAFMTRCMVLPYFHWMGTCAMKQKDINNKQLISNQLNDNQEWVVDENFCVRNVSNLRICDASIFPTLISAPIALTCAALGHILATTIILPQCIPIATTTNNDKNKNNS